MEKAARAKVRVTIDDGVNEQSYFISPGELEILHQLATIYDQTEVRQASRHSSRLSRLLKHTAREKSVGRLFGVWGI